MHKIAGFVNFSTTYYFACHCRVCVCVCMNHVRKDEVYGILGGTMALILFLVLVSSLA